MPRPTLLRPAESERASERESGRGELVGSLGRAGGCVSEMDKRRMVHPSRVSLLFHKHGNLDHPALSRLKVPFCLRSSKIHCKLSTSSIQYCTGSVNEMTPPEKEGN